MRLPVLTRAGGRAIRVHRPDHYRHLADSGDIELETLAVAKSGCVNNFDLDQLVVVRADTVDSLRAETVKAPEFADRKLRGVSNATQYIRLARRAHDVPGGGR